MNDKIKRRGTYKELLETGNKVGKEKCEERIKF